MIKAPGLIPSTPKVIKHNTNPNMHGNSFFWGSHCGFDLHFPYDYI
jgi:hypothetical protein